MDTVENIEPPIVPPLVIKTKLQPLEIKTKLPPLVITSYVNKTCGIKRRISIQNDVSPIRNFGSPLGSPAEKQQLQPPKKKARRGSVKKARSKSKERPPSSAQRKSNGQGKSHSKNNSVIKKEHLAPAEVPNLVEPLNEALATDDTTDNSSIKTDLNIREAIATSTTMQNLVKNVKRKRKNNKPLTKSRQRKSLTKGNNGLAASTGAHLDSSDGVNPIISKGKKTKNKSPRSNTRSSDAKKRTTRAAEKNQIGENVLANDPEKI